MAIKRVSDLYSILEGVNNNLQDGICRDVLNNMPSRATGGSETTQLKESLFEISWPRASTTSTIEHYSEFDSKTIDYTTLSAYITHNILFEDYQFEGNKVFTDSISATGENVYFKNENFGAYAKNINISGENTSIFGQENLILSVTNTISPDSHIDIINKKHVNISSDNLVVYGNTSKYIYEDSFTIYYRRPDGTLIEALVLGHTTDQKWPTAKILDNSTESNPVQCIAEHALWS